MSKRPVGASKESRDLVKRIRRAGFGVHPGGKSHLVVTDSDGARIVTFSSTPSDWRAVKNIIADLRRNGVEI